MHVGSTFTADYVLLRSRADRYAPTLGVLSTSSAAAAAAAAYGASSPGVRSALRGGLGQLPLPPSDLPEPCVQVLQLLLPGRASLLEKSKKLDRRRLCRHLGDMIVVERRHLEEPAAVRGARRHFQQVALA